eukprot:SRR837773.11816.p2 GENE.SRR837773.11816~~SRR837773.11816.p2  ORF type:complete len:233 (-),score=21.43 SRR837773.11816:213-872(-)
MGESVKDQLRQELQILGHGTAPPGAGAANVDRLAWELGEERNERQRLVMELLSAKHETELLRASMDGTNEHVINLSRELRHLIKGRSSRPSSDGGSLEALAKELRGDLLSTARTSSRKSGLRSPATAGRLLSGRPSAIERIEEEPEVGGGSADAAAAEARPAGVKPSPPRGWGLASTEASAGANGAPAAPTATALDSATSADDGGGLGLSSFMGRFMGR